MAVDLDAAGLRHRAATSGWCCARPGPGRRAEPADQVRAALPALIDAAALPDEVVVLDALPVAGRSRKPDQAAVRALFA
jgi:hypothetical protein